MRVLLDWNNGHFKTDHPDMARQFARSPRSFQPQISDVITQDVRDTLDQLIAKHSLNGKYPSQYKATVDGVNITVETVEVIM